MVTFNLSGTGLLVQSFHVPALAHFKRGMDEHFKKLQPGTLMDLPRLSTILRNESQKTFIKRAKLTRDVMVMEDIF